MIKGIIFDLDGTLLNTINDLATAVNQTMQHYHKPTYSNSEVMAMVGHGFRSLIINAMHSEETALIDEALAIFIASYDQCYSATTAPYPGITELLKELAEQNILMAVNSNKRQDYTEHLITKNFTQSFVSITGQQKNKPAKPDPTVALEIVEKMQLKPEEVAYIGDSETDIQTGKNGHMVSIGCSWGFRGHDLLSLQQPDYLIEQPEEILNIIKSKK